MARHAVDRFSSYKSPVNETSESSDTQHPSRCRLHNSSHVLVPCKWTFAGRAVRGRSSNAGLQRAVSMEVPMPTRLCRQLCCETSGEDAELQDAPSYSASLGSLVMCDVCITKCRSSNFSTRLRSRPWRSTANHPKLFAALEYMSGPIVQHPHAATVLSEVRALQS